MKRLLSHPVTNAVGISIFSLFYGGVLIAISGNAAFTALLSDQNCDGFRGVWSRFLQAGNQQYIAYALIAITFLVVVLLFLRRKPYDEYHTAILVQCLVVAVVLTLTALALFYLIALTDPTGFIEKFTFFAIIHWATVVLADLVYVLICKWR